MDSESTNLSSVLHKDQAGAVLNSGSVLKALLVGLPFWGVKAAVTSSQTGNSLTNWTDIVSLSERPTTDQHKYQFRRGTGFHTEPTEYTSSQLHPVRCTIQQQRSHDHRHSIGQQHCICRKNATISAQSNHERCTNIQFLGRPRALLRPYLLQPAAASCRHNIRFHNLLGRLSSLAGLFLRNTDDQEHFQRVFPVRPHMHTSRRRLRRW